MQQIKIYVGQKACLKCACLGSAGYEQDRYAKAVGNHKIFCDIMNDAYNPFELSKSKENYVHYNVKNLIDPMKHDLEKVLLLLFQFCIGSISREIGCWGYVIPVLKVEECFCLHGAGEEGESVHGRASVPESAMQGDSRFMPLDS